MKTIRAVWMTATACCSYVSGRISEAEARRRINKARALIGLPPMAGG